MPMKTLRRFAWLAWVILGGYPVAWTFGLFVLGPLLIYLVVSGRFIIRGYWRLLGNVIRGRVLILANHPSILAETFFLGALLFPIFPIMPWGVVWTMPDTKLLDRWGMPGWMRLFFRTIVVDRSS